MDIQHETNAQMSYYDELLRNIYQQHNVWIINNTPCLRESIRWAAAIRFRFLRAVFRRNNIATWQASVSKVKPNISYIWIEASQAKTYHELQLLLVHLLLSTKLCDLFKNTVTLMLKILLYVHILLYSAQHTMPKLD